MESRRGRGRDVDIPRRRASRRRYLNFRVFGRQGEFLKSQETRCVDAAHLTLALSESDAVWFRTLKPLADVEVLLPPLRLDLERLARKRPKVKRDLLTCVVRLSAEKEPERFVRLVEHLAARKAFDEGHGYPENLRPVLITGRAELEGDSPLVKRFLAAHPAAEAYPYMTPRGLAELFGRTRLLVHPPARVAARIGRGGGSRRDAVAAIREDASRPPRPRPVDTPRRRAKTRRGAAATATWILRGDASRRRPFRRRPPPAKGDEHRYDAFGMTVVEAAAFGAPSVFVPNADVGAKHALVVRRDDETRVADCAVSKRRDAFSLRGRVPERLSEILANFESGLTSGWVPRRSRRVSFGRWTPPLGPTTAWARATRSRRAILEKRNTTPARFLETAATGRSISPTTTTRPFSKSTWTTRTRARRPRGVVSSARPVADDDRVAAPARRD